MKPVQDPDAFADLAAVLPEMDWLADAKCRNLPGRMFFSGLREIDPKNYCIGCPVQHECEDLRQFAGMEDGVWGGRDARDRAGVAA